jgi:hypothetical protein
MPTSQSVLISQQGNTTTITLAPKARLSKKIFVIFACMMLLLYTITISYTFIKHGTIIDFAISLAFIIVAVIILLNILATTWYKEQVTLSANTLSITLAKPWRANTTQFAIDSISTVTYLGYEQAMAHPIGSTSTDFTGLAEREQMVNSINHQGNIAFTYDDSLIRFGKNIPSWDAEHVIDTINNYIAIPSLTSQPNYL